VGTAGRLASTRCCAATIPADKVRFHTCYGINEGPRIYEAALSDIIEYMLKIKAGSYSFEAANPRHGHEYHLFERVKVPEGKVHCQAGRPRERDCRCGLRLFITGFV
jgi:methionine synthase II (cobalamin-independent)